MPRIHYWAIRAVVWLVCLAPLYLLLSAALSWQEAVAGVLCAAIATAAVLATQAQARLRFAPRPGWLKHFARLPWQTLVDCWHLLKTLWEQIRHPEREYGTFVQIPFDPGSDDPQSAARRALVVIGMSFPPNTYVVSVDQKQQTMLVHQLTSTSEPPGHGDREWPL